MAWVQVPSGSFCACGSTEEQAALNRQVAGSSPVRRTIRAVKLIGKLSVSKTDFSGSSPEQPAFADMAQMVGASG